MKNYTINSKGTYEMNKKELKDLITQGLKNGLVIISDNLFDYGVMDVGCKIGDNAFYFGGFEVEGMSLEDFKLSFDTETIISMITEAIWEMYENYSPDEAWYYYWYLKENKVVNLLLETYDNKNNFVNIEFSVPSSWFEKYIDSSIEEFLNDYTSEESEDIYAHAILDNAIIARHFSF